MNEVEDLRSTLNNKNKDNIARKDKEISSLIEEIRVLQAHSDRGTGELLKRLKDLQTDEYILQVCEILCKIEKRKLKS